MIEWQTLPLGEAIDFNPSEPLSKGTIAKKISMEHLVAGERHVTGYELAEFSSNPKFRNGDTLLAKITPCLENGKTAQVDILEEHEVGFGSTEFIVLRENLFSVNDFVYYFARSPVFRRKAITCMEGTSGRKRVNENALKLQEVPIPDLETQKKIASVLSALDAKIELNNRINRELEALARTIYDYWFVQFDFPDANGRPYKSSGGKMIYSAQLKREIPIDWEAVPINEIVRCNYSSVTKGSKYKYINYLDTANLTDNVISNMEKLDLTIVAKPQRAQRIVKKNDILYSTVRPNQRHFGIIREPLENMVASSGFVQLTSKNENVSNEFIYLFLTANSTVSRLTQIAGLAVSSYPSISPSDVLDLTPPLPQNRNLKSINAILKSCFAQIWSNHQQSRHLAALRDWLLPLLMNGQATVK